MTTFSMNLHIFDTATFFLFHNEKKIERRRRKKTSPYSLFSRMKWWDSPQIKKRKMPPPLDKFISSCVFFDPHFWRRPSNRLTRQLTIKDPCYYSNYTSTRSAARYTLMRVVERELLWNERKKKLKSLPLPSPLLLLSLLKFFYILFLGNFSCYIIIPSMRFASTHCVRIREKKTRNLVF